MAEFKGFYSQYHLVTPVLLVLLFFNIVGYFFILHFLIFCGFCSRILVDTLRFFRKIFVKVFILLLY